MRTRRMLRWLLPLLLWPALASAQPPSDTPTVTPTNTPTQTPTITLTPTLPWPTAPQGKSAPGEAPKKVTLLAGASAPVTSAPVWVAHWPHVAVQVTVGTCTSYSLSMKGSIDGGNWDTIGAAITQANAAENTTEVWAIPAGYRYVEADLTAATDCTLTSVTLGLNP